LWCGWYTSATRRSWNCRGRRRSSTASMPSLDPCDEDHFIEVLHRVSSSSSSSTPVAAARSSRGARCDARPLLQGMARSSPADPSPHQHSPHESTKTTHTVHW
jgi:hypothetical protein